MIAAGSAELIFFAIAVPLWVIWLLGIRFAYARAAPSPGQGSSGGDQGKPEVLTGEASIPGDAERISRQLAERLASNPGGVPLVRLTARTGQRVEFERVRGLQAFPAFDRGSFTLEQRGEEVRVRYQASLERYSRMIRLVLGLVCFLYGGVFVLGGPLLLWFLVVKSSDPVVQGQVWQTLQMLHGVWPPFLVGFLAGRIRRMTEQYLQTLLDNLRLLV